MRAGAPVLIVEAPRLQRQSKAAPIRPRARRGGYEQATALLGLLEETLHLMHWHRAAILEKVAANKGLEQSKGADGVPMRVRPAPGRPRQPEPRPRVASRTGWDVAQRALTGSLVRRRPA